MKVLNIDIPNWMVKNERIAELKSRANMLKMLASHVRDLGELLDDKPELTKEQNRIQDQLSYSFLVSWIEAETHELKMSVADMKNCQGDITTEQHAELDDAVEEWKYRPEPVQSFTDTELRLLEYKQEK